VCVCACVCVCGWVGVCACTFTCVHEFNVCTHRYERLVAIMSRTQRVIQISQTQVQPIANSVAQNPEIFWNFVKIPELCPWDLRLVPDNIMVLISNPTRTLIRLVLNWNFYKCSQDFVPSYLQLVVAVRIFSSHFPPKNA